MAHARALERGMSSGPAGDQRTLLRFITCGSVDDGKSTLLGRLLFDAGLLSDDQLATLASDSKRVGTRNGELDYALLLDGLSAEREQGITIDVAYRLFSTPRRKFIAADTPGHEQYTRNMVTGASTADLAVVLVDARKGVLRQTQRHSCIVGLLGIRHVVLAVTKMDLVGYSEETFRGIEHDYRAFARRVGIENVVSIPLSGVHGDNVHAALGNTPWYAGPSLVDHLESVAIDDGRAARPFRMPVQWVNRPHLDFRGLAGTVASGTLSPGDRVTIEPSGRATRVTRIVTRDGDLDRAVPLQAVTLTLEDEVDASRGDIICAADAPARSADQFEATLVWMHEAPMLRGRSYLLKIGASQVTATIAPLKYRVNVETLEHLAAESLAMNEIGVCELALDRPIAFEPYAADRDLGGFILVDRLTNDTVGAGMLNFALRRADNVHWQALDLGKRAHAAQKGQRPCILWFTGLSGAGKSTIANLVEKKLHAAGRHTYLLDGDNVRHGLNRDLGFTAADRVENIRRIAEVGKLMVDAGLIVLTAFISPFRSEREMARGLVERGEFVEVYIDTPLAVAEARDVKGLYAKARRGELANFTGVDSPYEPPVDPEIRIDTTAVSAEDAAEQIVEHLRRRLGA
jgi:bifunctional enzyme CysN/CysC